MQNSVQIEQKTQQLAYAVIRIAGYIRRASLRSRLEVLSFDFIELVSQESFEQALRQLNALKNLVEFGKQIFLIEPINSILIIKEIEALNAAIRQFAGLLPLPDLSNDMPDMPNKPDRKDRHDKQNTPNDKTNKFDAEIGKIRQEKISAIIRQSGKVQLKDLIAEFPGVSERTLRYDLKKLTDEGKLSRQGTGGPSNFYTLTTELSTGVTNS